MDTPAVITKDGPVPGSDRIYRVLNPKHFVDGKPGDNHFSMSRNHPPGEGISTGIASRISISGMRSLEVFQSYGGAFAIANLSVSDVLMPVAAFGISVVQRDASDWGLYAEAHAVITGYQSLRGVMEGKRKLKDFQRHLVKLACKCYYPAGADAPISVE